jgi:hypothetical protein
VAESRASHNVEMMEVDRLIFGDVENLHDMEAVGT